MKILHIITSLGSGGTEGMLYRLILASKDNVDHSVICFKKNGKYISLLKEAGIDLLVTELKFYNFIFVFYKIFKFAYQKKSQGYQIITSWLYHADIVAWFIKKVFRYKGLVWNIRSTKLVRKNSLFTNHLFLKILAKLSYFGVNIIISCSKNSINFHIDQGYNSKIFNFIPNGYIIEKSKKFIKSNKKYEGVYKICIVARWHPQKDFENLFQSLVLLKSYNIKFHLTIAGSNTGEDNDELVSLLKSFKIYGYCSLLGEIEDIDSVYAKSHICVLSSSFGEAFPNVLCESMLNFTPCISTDIGDAADILDDVGYIIPIEKPSDLAEALIKNYQILKDNNDLYLNNCLNAFKKVSNNYDIKIIMKKYYKVWESLL